MSSSCVYIYVRMSGNRKYRCGRNTWVSNCTTVGASSTTNSTSCWASIPVSLASDLLWEPAKLAIGVAELCARTTGHGRWVLQGGLWRRLEMWWSHCDRDSALFPRWKQDFDHISHALTLGSANNLISTVPQTRHRIPLVKRLYQILFRVEFRISGVGIWALVRQWVWLCQYSQERWQTYTRAYSPQRRCQ